MQVTTISVIQKRAVLNHLNMRVIPYVFKTAKTQKEDI